jgi:hypothetical protein
MTIRIWLTKPQIFECVPSKVVKQVDLWFLVVALWKHTPRMSKLDYFEDEQWIHEEVVVYFFAYFQGQ